MSQDEIALATYHAKYNNDAYNDLRNAIRFDLQAYGGGSEQMLADEMNRITNAALEICGHPFYIEAHALLSCQWWYDWRFSHIVKRTVEKYLNQFRAVSQ